MSKNHREPEVPEAEVPAVERLDGLARITLKELAITHSVKNGTLQNACSTRPRAVVGLERRCSFAHRQADEQPTKRSKKNDDKSAVAMLKKGNWQEREPVTDECHDRPGKPGKKSDKKLGQNHLNVNLLMHGNWVAYISGHDAAEVYSPEGHRHAETNPTFEIHKGYCTSYQNSRPKSFARIFFAQVNLISVAPTLQNLRIGLRRRQSGKSKVPAEAAWKLAKSVLKLKEHQRAAFFSPSENGCLPASMLKPEEREFVVDSGASMHMISKKDLSNAEMDTLTKSCSPTIDITANGEVQTHEEAIVYVKELDIFLTMKVLDNTPAVLSLGKLCDENGYSYEWINGQKPHLIKDGIGIICNTENFVPIVVPG